MKYNKLIRDKIPELIASHGGTSKTHVADGNEFWVKLKEKLVEEAQEFVKDESEAELADLQEVVEAICTFKKYDTDQITSIKQSKLESRGGFTKRLILEESSDN